MRKRLFLCYLAVQAAILASADTLHINTQSDFDATGSRIEAAVNAGAKTIDVLLEGKTFFFKQNHIVLKNKRWNDVSISLRGNNTIITPAAPQLQDATPPSPLMQTDRLIEVVDEQSKLCRVYIGKQKVNSTANANIRITQWFKSVSYEVVRIKGKWIYFTAHDLSYNKNYRCYNVNLDYGYSHKRAPGAEVMPRFRLEQAPTFNSQFSIFNFLSITSSRLNSLNLSGISFAGNASSNDGYLINIDRLHAQTNITNCKFTSIRSGVIQALGCDSLSVTDCTFSRCYRHGIFASYSTNTTITGNTFTQMGLDCLNSFCVRCSGKDYYIAHNTFRDFGYCGIALGTWWQASKRTDETGVVEHNQLFYSPSYMASWRRHSLMDSGAIYLYTQNDSVVIRHNNIHDYNGACDNRGIFCDDGASNFSIYANTIRNIPNSFCIDSRRTPNIETDERSKVRRVNLNNRIYDNDVDGPIRFEPREK